MACYNFLAHIDDATNEFWVQINDGDVPIGCVSSATELSLSELGIGETN